MSSPLSLSLMRGSRVSEQCGRPVFFKDGTGLQLEDGQAWKAPKLRRFCYFVYGLSQGHQCSKGVSQIEVSIECLYPS